MRTTRQQQRGEARVWRVLAEAMAVKEHGYGLCLALSEVSEGFLVPKHLHVYDTIRQAVRDQGHAGWLDDRVFGPDWDRCLFACLMAAVAEAGDMDTYRGED